MIDPKESNRIKKRDKRVNKNKYGMRVSWAGRTLALILKNMRERKN